MFSHSIIDCTLHPSIDQLQNSDAALMEEFHCSATMDDDQEGDWREILQKWDALAAAAHSDDQIGLGSSTQQPTCCTSLLNAHGSLAMESLNTMFNPHSHGFPPSITFGIPSPHSFIPTSLSSLEAPDNLISTVRQQNESSDISRSLWLSDFLQPAQSHHVASTGLVSSSSSYSNLLNIGDGNQRGTTAASQTNMNVYSNQEGLDELMMEQMNNNDFINYEVVGSLQEQLSNALCAADMILSSKAELKLQSEGATCMRGVPGSGSEEAEGVQTLLVTPASSVSSDGGPEDDSDSHEDMKDSVDVGFDDVLMAGDQQSKLNMRSSLQSSDTHSSKATTKLLQGDTSAAPSSSHVDQDKKRPSKSARATKKPKRERGPKLAIKIQSDVEVLDDGYKWRKYGQKAVKNSPYPRSYYKCTDKQCKVKKHVERQAHEPDYVVTTYEGVHNHSRPDQQVQVLHSQSDISTQQHESFQAFVPTSSTHHHLAAPMERFSRLPSSLFQADSQQPPLALPLQQEIPTSPHALQAIDPEILQNLLHGGEPRRSSI